MTIVVCGCTGTIGVAHRRRPDVAILKRRSAATPFNMPRNIRPLREVLWSIAALVAVTSCGSATEPRAPLRERILRSRHLGPHSLGYNNDSMAQLARSVGPEDFPGLFALMGDAQVRIGAAFSIASQCSAAIEPVQEASRKETIAISDANDVMDLIAGFDGCDPDARARARDARVRSDIDRVDRLRGSAERRTEAAEAEEAIRRNAGKLTNAEQRATLTRAQREELFTRSIKAAGMEHPRTPAEEQLIERMYRAMVLDAAPPRK